MPGYLFPPGPVPTDADPNKSVRELAVEAFQQAADAYQPDQLPGIRKKIVEWLSNHEVCSGLVEGNSDTCTIAAVNLAATGIITDSPHPCVSPVILGFVIPIQDLMSSQARNDPSWRDLIPLIAGSADTPEVEELRVQYLVTQMWDVAFPLHLANLHRELKERPWSPERKETYVQVFELIGALRTAEAASDAYLALPFSRGEPALRFQNALTEVATGRARTVAELKTIGDCIAQVFTSTGSRDFYGPAGMLRALLAINSTEISGAE